MSSGISVSSCDSALSSRPLPGTWCPFVLAVWRSQCRCLGGNAFQMEAFLLETCSLRLGRVWGRRAARPRRRKNNENPPGLRRSAWPVSRLDCTLQVAPPDRIPHLSTGALLSLLNARQGRSSVTGRAATFSLAAQPFAPSLAGRSAVLRSRAASRDRAAGRQPVLASLSSWCGASRS